MASLLANHTEIEVVRTAQNTTEETQNPQEKSGQTFVKGTPVMLSGGFIQAWDGATIIAGIFGIAQQDANNLGSSGAGAPTAFTPVGFPGAGLSFGKVPFQPSGLNIPEGAPPVKGVLTCAQATLDTVFRAQTDNNTGAATTPTIANIGTQYGMTIDANGHWYVDFAKITAGTNTVVQMIDLDPIDGSIANARILFKFIKAAMQIDV